MGVKYNLVSEHCLIWGDLKSSAAKQLFWIRNNS